MDQKDIEIFLDLTKTNNLTKTAQNLFMTQSTISSRLSSLENEIGTNLVDRSRGSKAIKLTPYGEQFKIIAEKMIELLQEAVKIKNDTKIGLNIGIVDSFSNIYFGEILEELYGLLTNYSVSIKVCNSPEIYDLVESGLLDIGIVTLKESRRNILVQPVFSEKMCIVSNYDEKMPKKIQTKDLDIHDELFLNWGEEFIKWHERNFGNGYKPRMELNSMPLTKNILKNFKCWAVVSYDYAVALSRDIDIQISEPEDPIKNRTIYTVKPIKDKPWKGSGISLFIETLHKHLQKNNKTEY